MLQNFAYYAQIMLHIASMLHKFNISFLLSHLNHEIMSISSLYLAIAIYFPNTVQCHLYS